MKKFELNLEELKVESFETKSNNKNSKGTVIGNALQTSTEGAGYCNTEQCGTESGSHYEYSCGETYDQTCGSDTAGLW